MYMDQMMMMEEVYKIFLFIHTYIYIGILYGIWYMVLLLRCIWYMIYIYRPPPKIGLPGVPEGLSRGGLGCGEPVYSVYTHIAWI